jgi:hypothetical protein
MFWFDCGLLACWFGCWFSFVQVVGGGVFPWWVFLVFWIVFAVCWSRCFFLLFRQSFGWPFGCFVEFGVLASCWNE